MDETKKSKILQNSSGEVVVKIDKNYAVVPMGKSKTIVLQVTSAGFVGGNKAEITIDGRNIDKDCPFLLNEAGNSRGLHIAVINPTTGAVELAQIFDTARTSEQLETWIKKELRDGDIIAAACKEDCFRGMSKIIKQWFISLGS